MVQTTQALTQRRITGAIYRGPKPQRDIHWDRIVQGLGLRIYPSGKKAFVLRYRSCGRERLMVLGRLGVLTLDQARRRARSELNALEKGPDPLDERARRRGARTVRELVNAYMANHAKVHKKTWAKGESQLKRHVLSRWANRQASSIRRDEVIALHNRIGKESGPYEANRTIEVVRTMFNWGGVVDDGGKNPARFGGKRTRDGIQRFPEEKRDRWVRPDELPRLTKAIDAEADPYARAALWLYLLTGLRKSCACGADKGRTKYPS